MSEAAPTPTSPVMPASSGIASLNAVIKRRQTMLMASAAAVVVLGIGWATFGIPHDKTSPTTAATTIDTAGLVNRDLSQREFVALYANRLDALARDQKSLKDGQVPTATDLQAQLDALKSENQAMKTDGQAAIDAVSAENSRLKSQLAVTPAIPPAAPPPAYGPGGGYNARTPGGAAGTSASVDPGATAAEVKLLSFGGDKGSGRTQKPELSPLIVEDSPDYLPPNSYAPARVIVGVDASVGVASQTDPLPVVLRITGPARSVVKNGRVLTTRIQGCVVNGAARGDLSSEKVYVKLAKMTCDQPGGRVAVSEVKGFISFAGKSGVRGRVVSREGNLITQALLAGVVGGFGRGFSANANSVFSGVTGGSSGTRPKLSAGDIIGGGLGQGAGDAADTVSKYLIERAEQYQPVVEMPTGIEVEIVFLDGAYVRNKR